MTRNKKKGKRNPKFNPEYSGQKSKFNSRYSGQIQGWNNCRFAFFVLAKFHQLILDSIVEY
jgi:hypothetical protein